MAASLDHDLHSIRLFLVVAETGSLTKAADQTSLTLSAVSKRISDLERRIDCQLLVRMPRGIELTAAGRGFIVHARQIVDRVNRMAHEMSDFASGVRGHIRVWANTSAIIQFLPQDMRSFLRSNSAIKISIEEKLSGEIVKSVNDGKADIGVFADNVPAPGIDKEVYRQDRLVLLVPVDHPLASATEVAFIDTLDYDYVGLNEGSSLLARLLNAAFAFDRILNVRIQVSSFDGICRMIEQGLGIGILPLGAVRAEILAAGLKSVSLSDSWAHRTLYIGTKSRELLSPEARRLFEFMTTEAKSSKG
ncbi:LysR family transcriptional regulator [Paraburkholderia sediminicola]|uniref:LysR family transcriptional regulator n=1 Tax=Paraburkholderia metrosideri TaxID=580937 RepID=A0ABW9E1F1_9BURK